MSYDLKNEKDVQDYIKNLGTEYRFGCFKEKNPEVCHLLGDYLEAIQKDYEKALKVYRSNCDDYSFSKSCYKTATYYVNGKGIQKSEQKALEYFDKGCKLKDPSSCFRSGIHSILNSRSTKPTRTFSQGVENLIQSCNGDFAEACHHLSAIYMDGESSASIPRDMSKAFEYAIKGCNLGNVYACVNVSIMYKRGEGVEKDMALSDKFRKKAAELTEELKQRRQLVFQEGLKPA